MKINCIYVLAPASYKTGGVELAHQLVKVLNDNNIPSQIAYIGIQQDKDPLIDAFKEYISEYVDYLDIEDRPNNIIVAPEIYTTYLKKFSFAYRVIWWMSVDNYEKLNGLYNTIRYQGLPRAVKRAIEGKIHKCDGYLRYADLHLYQSEYARLHLLSKGYNNLMSLSDYINDLYFSDYHQQKRQNLILFNPKKGSYIFNKIHSACPEFQWVPLANMTTDEVAKLMRRSKLYIDFGNHPGKDRLPREAVASGCCIITGLRGSANNDIDINIPSKYKFSDSKKALNEIAEMIEDCIKNYDLHISDFREYYKKIENEKHQFKIDALNFAEYVSEQIQNG